MGRLVSVIFLLCLAFTDAISATIVSTNVGMIAGLKKELYIDGKYRVLTEFLGIPYGEDTSGQNRFKKPIPKAQFKGTFNAFNNSPVCMQAGLNITDMTEDCLMLNIYVPRDLSSSVSAKQLPVMIWIHGGGYMQGAARLYPGEALSTIGDIILVTVNYRLTVFGFLDVGNSEANGNQGLWDQQLAIKWVKNNINGFVGNPDEITIFGESAGGHAVTLQSLYAGNSGLFKRAIAESGSAVTLPPVTSDRPVDILFQLSSCDRNGRNSVDCLRNKSSEDLLKIISTPNVSFGPTLDNDFIVEKVLDTVFGNHAKSFPARQFFRSLDIMTGVNEGEGIIILAFLWLGELGTNDVEKLTVTQADLKDIVVPWVIRNYLNPATNDSFEALRNAISFEYTDWRDPNNSSVLRSSLMKLASDIFYFVPAVETMEGHSKHPLGRSFLYQFSAEPPYRIVPTPTWFRGANHADELPYVFGLPFLNDSSLLVPTLRNGTVTDKDKQLSRGMITAWTNFAKSGDPNKPVAITQYFNTTWPEYDTAFQTYLQVDEDMSITSAKQHFSARSTYFWTKLIPEIIKEASRKQSDLVSTFDEIIG